MATLTSRTLATGITSTDLIHIVIPDDTSQSPEGSSYKATIGQVLELVLLSGDTYVTGGTYDNNTGIATFTNNKGVEFDVTGFYTEKIYTTSGITTSSATLDINYTYYGVNYDGNVNLTLPDATGLDGNFLIIKDEGGNSGTYGIRLLSSLNLIDGSSYVDMNTNFMSLTIIARNNNWWII
jgi:hypothetical protein